MAQKNENPVPQPPNLDYLIAQVRQLPIESRDVLIKSLSDDFLPLSLSGAISLQIDTMDEHTLLVVVEAVAKRFLKTTAF